MTTELLTGTTSPAARPGTGRPDGGRSRPPQDRGTPGSSDCAAGTAAARRTSARITCAPLAWTARGGLRPGLHPPGSSIARRSRRDRPGSGAISSSAREPPTDSGLGASDRRRSSRPSGSGRRSGSIGCGSRTTVATRPCRSRTAPSRSQRAGHGVWDRGVGLRVDREPGRSDRRGRGRDGAAGVRLRAGRPGAGQDRHVLAYGATVVPVDGTYDDVNRLCLEVADELGWGFVNVNLRPFYAEGSKTLAYEIAEDLGWRLPDVSWPRSPRAPSTQDRPGLRRAARSGCRAEAGPVRRWPGRRVCPGRPPRSPPAARSSSRFATRTRSCSRWPSATRPTGARPWSGALHRRLGGGHPRRGHRRGDPPGGTARGDLPETAGGVTIAAAEAARQRGVIRPDDEVVALLTGNGLKTPDAVRLGLDADPPRARQPGLAPTIPASYTAFEAWLEAMSIVRIPPVLRASTGGQKQVEVAGGTVREVIGGLVATYPGLEPQHPPSDGDLNRFVNVFLNDTDVRHLQALETPVEDRDTVLLLPAMAGGPRADGRRGADGGPAARHPRRLLLLSGASPSPLIRDHPVQSAAQGSRIPSQVRFRRAPQRPPRIARTFLEESRVSLPVRSIPTHRSPRPALWRGPVGRGARRDDRPRPADRRRPGRPCPRRRLRHQERAGSCSARPWPTIRRLLRLGPPSAPEPEVGPRFAQALGCDKKGDRERKCAGIRPWGGGGGGSGGSRSSLIGSSSFRDRPGLRGRADTGRGTGHGRGSTGSTSAPGTVAARRAIARPSSGAGPRSTVTR